MGGRQFSLLVRCALLTLAGAWWLTSSSDGQPQLGNQMPRARLSTVMPCGGKAGATVEVTLTGADLDGAEALVFSHPGIKATVIIPPEPEPKPNSKSKDAKAKDPMKDQPPPPPMPKFTVSIGDHVPVGFYDVRFVGKHGITNARTFVVGDLTEVLEREPNNDVDQAQRVEINSTVNGTIAQPADVDYYVFAGKKGQRVLVHCQAATIDSKLTPEIKVLDGNNREIAAARAAPLMDGLMDVTLPHDGDFKVRLVQFAHQIGGPELFYRLNITTGPWIDAVFPPVVEAGKTNQITVYGRNLPGGQPDPNTVVGGCTLEKVTVPIKALTGRATRRLVFGGNVPPSIAMLDGFEYRIQNEGHFSNPVLLTYAHAPVILEQEPNDSPDTAQLVPVPCEIAGRFDKVNDRDWYAFTAKKGEIFVIEAFSHRLGAPTDLFLTVRNSTGKQAVDMVQLDDNVETLNQMQFATASRDPPPYRFVAPADGRYELMIGSHLAAPRVDLRHYYTIRIAPEKPDFRLIVMAADNYRPEACTIGAGGNQDLTVYVVRQDGFKGEVDVRVEGLPPDVTCKPQVIGPGIKQGSIVLNAAKDCKPWAGTLTVKGTAIIAGKTVEREARPACITWQVPALSNIPAITRLERSFALAVRGQAPYNLECGFDRQTVVHGSKVIIPVKLTRNLPDFKAPLQIVPIPNELPPGVSFANVTLPPDKSEQNLVLNLPTNVAPGNYTFVFKSSANVPLVPKGKAVNVVQCSTAVVLTVLPKQVATVSVSNSSPALKPGAEMELLVKVKRQFDYQDSLTVKLLLPAGALGIGADEVTIAAGQNEVKLVLRAEEDAVPGPRNSVIIQAAAVLQGVTITQETKINVNVTK